MFKNRLHYNNHIIEIIAVIIAFLLLSIKSNNLSYYISTNIGKAISIIIIYIMSTSVSPFLGALFAIVFVILLSEIKEGLSNDNNKNKKNIIPKTKEIFKEQHCKVNDKKITFVDSEGNPVSLDEMESRYPNISFNGELCDPCDDNCEFSIEERMTVEEDIRRSKEGRGTAVLRNERVKV